MIENLVNPFRAWSNRDVERDYRFEFTLTPHIHARDLKFQSLAILLFPYVSTLAKKVDPIPRKLEVEYLQIGVISVPVPKKIDLETFRVEYIEDNEATAWNTHRQWMSLIGGIKGFKNLYTVSATCQYSPFYENPISSTVKALKFVPIPTSVNIYPHVVPISVRHSPFNKEGSGISTVTVEYVLLPSYFLDGQFTNTASVTHKKV